MAEKFIIIGEKPLEGEVEIRGYKNAAGPALCASLLTDEECVIGNLPLVEDILNIIEVIKSLGAKVEWVGERAVKIKADSIDINKVNFEKISQTRISVLLFGALLLRVGEFKMPAPGGDRIGLRPIYTHLETLRELGAEIEKDEDGNYIIRAKNVVGKEIILEEFSVTATENLMLAASLAEGETIIKTAASEPQITDLGNMLNKMGGDVIGMGTSIIKIKGVKKLKGVSHDIIFDLVEAGTFISLAAITEGTVKIKNIDHNHLDIFLKKLKNIGVKFEKEKEAIKVFYSPNLKSAKIQALPWPGFPTDLLPVIIPLLTKAQGKSLIHDPLYENRFNYIHQLRKMGADIEMVDPHRAFVFGPTKLSGLKIESWDIRAGACLIIAGLMAKGKTIIENIYQVDRGYEKIEERLQKIGADIKRVNL